MITLTIDGRAVSVAEGTTILDAARAQGIEIPTLCHITGLEPVSACFLCVVQIEGRRQLSPSCAMPAAEGMVVTTDSEDIRKARRMAMELLLSDHAGECVAPCAAACPAGLEIPKFAFELARGDTRRATEAIGERLALPGALGRVCPRLCEKQCRRGEHDHSLEIGRLHQHAVETDYASKSPYVPLCAPPSGKQVAIIGAGPAGLSAAWFLQQRGHQCTLLDAKSEAGGMLRWGVPEFRLPKAALDVEIGAVARLGARFRFDCRWGADFTVRELRDSFDAVFIAIGAQHAHTLRCEGEELSLSAIEMLELVATGNPPSLGDDVVVVGGGNTAVDAARTAKKLGACNVRVLYRRTRAEMPCLMEEVEEAEAEGVRFEFLIAPVRLEQDGLNPLSLTCQRMSLGTADESGRGRPVPVEGSEFTIGCSTVIAAIGQTVDRALAEREGLRVTGWGIATKQRTLETNLPGVFAGGDAVLGADVAVRAVAAGRLAAVSIDQYLRGEKVVGEPASAAVAFRPVDDLERASLFRDIERVSRAPVMDAEMEARRCLSCGCRKADCCNVRALASEYGASPLRFLGERRRFSQDLSHPEIVYEPGKCIMCEACVRIAAKAGEPAGLAVLGRGFDVAVGVPFGGKMSEGLRQVWGECAEACPTAAIALRSTRACELHRADFGGGHAELVVLR